MAYTCICGTYVYEILELCRQCQAEFGEYGDWPDRVKNRYFDLNFGGDYEYGELDKLGRPNGVKEAPLGKAGDDLKGVQDPQLGELAGKLCPVCHTRIKPRERLCSKCFVQYGRDQGKWPKWVQALVTDDQRMADYERDHREFSVNDETGVNKKDANRPGGEGYKSPGSLGGRTYPRYNQNDLSREALDWGDNDLEGSGDLPEIGSIEGDKSGHKYNRAAWRGSGVQYNDISVFWERDLLDEKIAQEQEFARSDYTRQIVILLYGAGHNQTEIAELLGIDQQRVSDILRKAP